MGKNKNGYKPNLLKKVPRKPSNAEEERILKIYDFAYSVDFTKMNINWGKGRRGPKSSNPNALLAVWIYAYMYGNNFGRKIEKEIKRNKDLQFLSKGALFSFSILNKFRRLLDTCFDEILKKFIKYEGEPQGDFSMDGTQIECAGSHNQFRKKENLSKYKDKHLKKGNYKRVEEYQKAIEYSVKYPEINSINLREHDARTITHQNKKVLGYNLLCISDETRRIYGFRVYGINREVVVAIDFLELVQKNIDLKGHSLHADKDYFEGNLLRYLKEKGIKGFLMPRISAAESIQKKKGRYTRSDFRYDGERDIYICPEGKELTYVNIYKRAKSKTRLYYGHKDCRKCGKKSMCITEKCKERRISRPLEIGEKEEMIERMKEKYDKIRIKSIEPVFGGIKDEKQGNIRRFVLKGKDKVNIEGLLMVISFVLKLNDRESKNEEKFLLFLLFLF